MKQDRDKYVPFKRKLRFLVPAIKAQLPFRRLVKNLISGRILGLFSWRSHYRRDGNDIVEKISFSKKEKAEKSAKKMGEKRDMKFSIYVCIYCGKWHIGANRYAEKHKQNRYR